MAVDMYMKIDDVKGESRDSSHADEIDVLSWSWGATNSGSTHMGGGGGSGKANFQDVSFTKYIDKASYKLLEACAKGTHFKEAVLTIRKAGGNPIEYLIVKMNDLLVTSVSTGGSEGEERLTENITLNFAKFTYEYTPQKPDGSAEGKLPFTWSIEQNA